MSGAAEASDLLAILEDSSRAHHDRKGADVSHQDAAASAVSVELAQPVLLSTDNASSATCEVLEQSLMASATEAEPEESISVDGATGTTTKTTSLVVMLGPRFAGKTGLIRERFTPSHQRISIAVQVDQHGESLAGVEGRLLEHLSAGRNIVLDDVYVCPAGMMSRLLASVPGLRVRVVNVCVPPTLVRDQSASERLHFLQVMQEWRTAELMAHRVSRLALPSLPDLEASLAMLPRIQDLRDVAESPRVVVETAARVPAVSAAAFDRTGLLIDVVALLRVSSPSSVKLAPCSVAIIRQWMEQNPGQPVIVIIHESTLFPSAIAASDVPALRDLVHAVLRDMHLPCPLYYFVVEWKSVSASDFLGANRPGVFAFLQRRHCLNIAASVLVVHDTQSKRLASMASMYGLATVSHVALFRPPTSTCVASIIDAHRVRKHGSRLIEAITGGVAFARVTLPPDVETHLPTEPDELLYPLLQVFRRSGQCVERYDKHVHGVLFPDNFRSSTGSMVVDPPTDTTALSDAAPDIVTGDLDSLPPVPMAYVHTCAADETVLAAAQELFKSRRLRKIVAAADIPVVLTASDASAADVVTVTAECRASQAVPLTPQLVYRNATWHCSCTCTARAWCVHGIAVLYAICRQQYHHLHPAQPQAPTLDSAVSGAAPAGLQRTLSAPRTGSARRLPGWLLPDPRAAKDAASSGAAGTARRTRKRKAVTESAEGDLKVGAAVRKRRTAKQARRRVRPRQAGNEIKRHGDRAAASGSSSDADDDDDDSSDSLGDASVVMTAEDLRVFARAVLATLGNRDDALLRAPSDAGAASQLPAASTQRPGTTGKSAFAFIGVARPAASPMKRRRIAGTATSSSSATPAATGVDLDSTVEMASASVAAAAGGSVQQGTPDAVALQRRDTGAGDQDGGDQDGGDQNGDGGARDDDDDDLSFLLPARRTQTAAPLGVEVAEPAPCRDSTRQRTDPDQDDDDDDDEAMFFLPRRRG